MNIIAIDPGLTTGVAYWSTPFTSRPYTEQRSVEEMYELATHLLHSVSAGDDVAIVCEAYVISERTLKVSRQAWSLELIGLFKYVAWEKGWKFKLQQASSAKRFADNARLKALGWHVPGRDHANDALRHLHLYAVENRIVSL